MADDSSLDYFAGNWQVGSGKSIQAPLNRIRTWNYLLEQVLPKEKEGSIQGSVEDLKHYIGEAYFFRAMAYYKALVKYGDYPIVDKVLPDQEEILLEYSTRAPRNEVARQILKDLDEAINRMHDQGLMELESISRFLPASYRQNNPGYCRLPTGCLCWHRCVACLSSKPVGDIAYNFWSRPDSRCSSY